MKGGSTRTTRDISNQQFIFHYSVDDKTPIYSLRYDALLTDRACDEARIVLSPKKLLCLNYFHGIHQGLASAKIVCTSRDGRRVVIWRTWLTVSGEARLIVAAHDISGSCPPDIWVTPTQACPDEDILVDVPLDILTESGGYHLEHIGFGGKAIAWLTTDLTLMLLEIPSSEGVGTNLGIRRTRPWRIPSSVGLEHHGEVRNVYLDDSRGRVILAMEDETLVVFEFV